MKRLILILLITGTTSIYFSCSNDNSLDSNLIQNDQETSSTIFPGTSYAGQSNPVPDGFFDPGKLTVLPNGNVKIQGMTAEWYDTADTPLLTGTSMWYQNWSYNTENPKVKIWGKAEIFVEGSEGVWQGTFIGWGDFLGEPPYNAWTHQPIAEVDVIFTGHGGDIQGMVAQAKYSINTSIGLFWTFEGGYHYQQNNNELPIMSN